MDDIKITTGEGMGPGSAPKPPVPPAPPAPPAPPKQFSVPTAQPDFLSQDALSSTPIPAGVEGKGGALKTVLTIILGLVFVGGIGSLGYFVVYPLLFTPSTTPSVPNVVGGTPKPVPLEHRSFLVSAPAASTEIRLADTNYLTVINALQNESFNQLADNQLKEVRVSGNNGQVPFHDFFGGVAPAAGALGLSQWFENDFTALLYYDANGEWPIYVAKLKGGVDGAVVMNSFLQTESALDLSAFYLKPVGAFSGFRSGKIGNYPTRYNIGDQSGASFNYGFFGPYVIVSTSYNGLKTALPLLGL